MNAFDRYYKKEKLISRKLDIEEEMYNELQYLSDNVYDASINKLVNSAIEELVKKCIPTPMPIPINTIAHTIIIVVITFLEFPLW